MWHLLTIIVLLITLCSSVQLPLLGVFVGNPNGNNPTENNSTLYQLEQHNNAVGIPATCMNAFIAENFAWTDPSDIIGNINWSAWSWGKTPQFAELVPIIGVPMAMSSDWAKQPAIQTFKNIANGDYDQIWRAIPNAWKNHGFKTIYVRLGYEMNASFMPWSMGTTTESVDAWKAAFQRISTVVKSVDGITVKVTWNPASTNYGGAPTSDSYPGDEYVDVLCLDSYSIVWPVDLYDWAKHDGTIDPNVTVWQQSPINREKYWDIPGANRWNPNNPTNNNGWGMIAHQQFATTHKKSVAICESGVGISPSYPNQGIRDDGDFPVYLADRLFASGAPAVEFVNIWDTNVGDGEWKFWDDASNKPKARAAWAYLAKQLAAHRNES